MNLDQELDLTGKLERERLDLVEKLSGKWLEQEIDQAGISLGGSWGAALYFGYLKSSNGVGVWVLTYKQRIIDVYRDRLPERGLHMREEMDRAFASFYGLTTQSCSHPEQRST